jgi:hypothetical protein
MDYLGTVASADLFQLMDYLHINFIWKKQK